MTAVTQAVTPTGTQTLTPTALGAKTGPARGAKTATARGAKTAWAWARAFGGVGILALLVWQVGTGPFLDGVRVIDVSALVIASAIGVLTTVCSAWRWSLVAAGLGVRLPLRGAVAAYYRSQFLNTTLPGGVLGDVHRALRHGLDIGDVGLSVRAVVLERSAGHVAQVTVATLVLFAFPSPVRSTMPLVALGVVATGLVLVVAARALSRHGSSWLVRALRSVGSDIRGGLFAHRNWLAIVATSTVVLAGHLATFLLAARTAGATAPLSRLVPLTLLALLAMALPLSFAGWGPREGVAAWAFAAAGLTATQGVATAVTYGVLALVASLPGAVVLVAQWSTNSRATAVRAGERRG
jgi:glycosyltransferase 2 family protein